MRIHRLAGEYSIPVLKPFFAKEKQCGTLLLFKECMHFLHLHLQMGVLQRGISITARQKWNIIEETGQHCFF